MSMQNFMKVAAPTAERHYQGGADIVIVGNGIAGLTTAIEARRFAPDLRIAMITEQCHPTINTPALKQFATGKLEREQLLAYPVGIERAQRIQMIYGRVEEINAQGKFVCLSNGATVGYSSLLLATGSTASGLPAYLPGRDFDGVLTLHRLQDYMNLRRRLSEIDDAVVIGGGAHAIETVTSLLYLGIRTHWLVRKHTCMSRALDERASELLLKHMQRTGARVYTETEMLGIAGNVGAVAGVVTNHHQMIPCQLVVVCTGMRPVTTLAERCTLPMMYEQNEGIFVNDQMRTNIPGIYAAGDVAAIHNPQSGVHETRAQWYSAVIEGCSAAAAMTGQVAPATRTFGVPWQATRLGDLSLLSVGSPLACIAGSETLTDSRKGTYRRLTILDNRLIGYISLGQSQADGLAIKRLIDEGVSIVAVKEALLKGRFDARKYFAQQSSISIMDLATSGKLPVVRTTQRLSSPVTQSLQESVSHQLPERRKHEVARPPSIVGSIPLTTFPRITVGAQFRSFRYPPAE